MSKGLRTRDLPKFVHQGIKSAFRTWESMSGNWLTSAPEYLVSVHIAEAIKNGVDLSKRLVFLESSVSQTLIEAGAIQTGPNARRLRASGRYDVVVRHKNFRPRAVIEVKSPLWNPMSKAMISDLNRLCKSLLQNKEGTQIHSALMAIYVASNEPSRKDKSAKDRLIRKWRNEMPKKLNSCTWARSAKKLYLNNLHFKVCTKFQNHTTLDGLCAWGSVCIEITRKTKFQLAKNTNF